MSFIPESLGVTDPLSSDESPGSFLTKKLGMPEIYMQYFTDSQETERTL